MIALYYALLGLVVLASLAVLAWLAYDLLTTDDRE